MCARRRASCTRTIAETTQACTRTGPERILGLQGVCAHAWRAHAHAQGASQDASTHPRQMHARVHTPKERPKSGQERPKSGQEPAKSGQGRPKSGQESTKSDPRAAKSGQEQPKSGKEEQKSLFFVGVCEVFMQNIEFPFFAQLLVLEKYYTQSGTFKFAIFGNY